MKAVLICALVVVVLIGGGLLMTRFVDAPAYSEEELQAFGFVAYPQPREIPPFDLMDAGGGGFGPERLRGRWTLLFFGYANCPDICPVTLSTLGQAEKLLRKEGDAAFQGVLVSVDPARDKPAALAAYVAAFSERFVGVTGEAEAIQAFAESLHAGFSKTAVEDSALGYLMDHSSHVAVIDPDGRHRGYVRSPLDARKVASLVRALATD